MPPHDGLIPSSDTAMIPGDYGVGSSGRDIAMRAIVAAAVAAVVIAAGSWGILKSVQQPVAQAFTTTGARL